MGQVSRNGRVPALSLAQNRVICPLVMFGPAVASFPGGTPA